MLTINNIVELHKGKLLCMLYGVCSTAIWLSVFQNIRYQRLESKLFLVQLNGSLCTKSIPWIEYSQYSEWSFEILYRIVKNNMKSKNNTNPFIKLLNSTNSLNKVFAPVIIANNNCFNHIFIDLLTDWLEQSQFSKRKNIGNANHHTIYHSICSYEQKNLFFILWFAKARDW